MQLKEKNAVVINLEYVSKDVARRIVDVVCGAVKALDGNMEKVSNSIFVVAPYNYDIVNEIKNKELSEKYLEKTDDYNFITCPDNQILESIKNIVEIALEKGYREKDNRKNKGDSYNKSQQPDRRRDDARAADGYRACARGYGHCRHL